MNRAELASRLVGAEGAEARAELLSEHSALADVALAYALKDICLEAWSGDPPRAVAAAAALEDLAAMTDSPEVGAWREWSAGIAALVGGRMEQAVAHLDDAESRFQSLCQPHTAASTHVSKLIALAMLGRYDEAVEAGVRARARLLAHGERVR